MGLLSHRSSYEQNFKMKYTLKILKWDLLIEPVLGL